MGKNSLKQTYFRSAFNPTLTEVCVDVTRAQSLTGYTEEWLVREHKTFGSQPNNQQLTSRSVLK